MNMTATRTVSFPNFPDREYYNGIPLTKDEPVIYFLWQEIYNRFIFLIVSCRFYSVALILNSVMISVFSFVSMTMIKRIPICPSKYLITKREFLRYPLFLSKQL